MDNDRAYLSNETFPENKREDFNMKRKLFVFVDHIH